MQFIVPTIWETTTRVSAAIPGRLQQLALPGGRPHFMEGAWGYILSQSLTSGSGLYWRHDCFAKQPMTDGKAQKLAGARSLQFDLRKRESIFTHWPAGNSVPWPLGQGPTIIYQLDVEASLADRLVLAKEKIAPISRAAFTALEALPGDLAEQVAPGLYLEGVTALLLQEHLTALAEQERLLATAGAGISRRAFIATTMAKALLDTSLDKRLSVDALARQTGSNREQLRRDFKLLYGQTIHQYWLGVSLTRARTLVLSSDLPVKRVAAACGFDNYPYFIQQFRRYWGMTPGAMRKTI